MCYVFKHAFHVPVDHCFFFVLLRFSANVAFSLSDQLFCTRTANSSFSYSPSCTEPLNQNDTRTSSTGEQFSFSFYLAWLFHLSELHLNSHSGSFVKALVCHGLILSAMEATKPHGDVLASTYENQVESYSTVLGSALLHSQAEIRCVL